MPKYFVNNRSGKPLTFDWGGASYVLPQGRAEVFPKWNHNAKDIAEQAVRIYNDSTVTMESEQ